MKNTWERIMRVAALLLAILSISALTLVILSSLLFNNNDKDVFGYRFYLVSSDSMSATDFRAGDLILVKEVIPESLAEGDIITFVSQSSDSFGKIITHKIREKTTDSKGNPGFITYGTTTDSNDDHMVYYSDIVGKYQRKLPVLGLVFNFLKTPMGYVLLVFVPFALLICSRVRECIRWLKVCRKESAAKKESRERELQEENERMHEELLALREQLRVQQAQTIVNAQADFQEDAR